MSYFLLYWIVIQYPHPNNEVRYCFHIAEFHFLFWNCKSYKWWQHLMFNNFIIDYEYMLNTWHWCLSISRLPVWETFKHKVFSATSKTACFIDKRGINIAENARDFFDALYKKKKKNDRKHPLIDFFSNAVLQCFWETGHLGIDTNMGGIMAVWMRRCCARNNLHSSVEHVALSIYSSLKEAMTARAPTR